MKTGQIQFAKYGTHFISTHRRITRCCPTTSLHHVTTQKTVTCIFIAVQIFSLALDQRINRK